MGAGVDMGAYEGAVLPEDIVTLTISTHPAGVGLTVPPVGIYNYGRGDIALVRAHAVGGRFSHWTGAASGDNLTTTVLIDGHKILTAIFIEDIYRVDAQSTAVEADGRSWATAYPDIQSAVDAAWAAGGGEVWVAGGVYTATSGPVLTMKERVAIYGGFSGTETAREQRDWAANVTSIDGEEQRQCVQGANDSILDGFTVAHGTDGMYNTSSSPMVTNCTFAGNSGRGMYNTSSSSPTVINCTFAGNSGRGMYNESSSPTVTNCTFTGNTAYSGGGMYNRSSSSPTVINCTFAANSGGGMLNDSYSSPMVTNCTFTGNSGTGMYNYSSSATVTNCTFTGNSGTGMYNYSSSATVTNCILWGNSAGSGNEISGSGGTFTFSCIQGGYEGTGNIAVDPLFVNAPYSVQLLPGSPCIDAGTSVGAPAADILGRPRPMGAGVDMGAHEGAVLPGDIVTLTINTAPSGVGVTTPPVGVNAYGRGDIALVRAQAVVGGRFSHWTGAASGDSLTTTVIMDGHKTLTAIFIEDIYRVDVQSTAVEADGRSWATAYPDIQSAVNAAAGGGEVWVAGGVYTATTYTVLTMKEGVAIYGGFSGTETARGQRDWAANATTIDGEHRRECVQGSNLAVLNGFTITRGGGGMHNSSSSPTVTNCTFSGNMEEEGGGMYNDNSSPTVTNCIFVGNISLFDGGGMYNEDSSAPMVTNCTFTGNSATAGGGISSDSTSRPLVSNSILWGNTALFSPEIHVALDGTPISAVFSCIAGGYDGEGNIDANPLFVGAPYNLRLRAGSPCIDAGTTLGAPDTDILGRSRPDGGGIDMGAYEGAVAPGDMVTLTLGVSPFTGGVTIPPVGSNAYVRGETAVIEAHASGMAFSHWEGDLIGSESSAAILMEADMTATAVFVENIYRVHANSTASEPDGRTWATAYPTIQAAVDAAVNARGGEVWVAAGTYMDANIFEDFENPPPPPPPPLSDKENEEGEYESAEPGFVLIMKPGVALYGGFAGVETARDQRDWVANATIIDGEGTRTCVISAMADYTVLNGFAITHGVGNDSYSDYGGGGMQIVMSSPVVSNCTFTYNKDYDGGALTNVFSSPMFNNCVFSNNMTLGSRGMGGVMASHGGQPAFINCTFSNNSAAQGGSMFNLASQVFLTNCTFTNNQATQYGGAIYNLASPMALTNCTFFGNNAAYGGGLCNDIESTIFAGYNDVTDPIVTNCTFVNNTATEEGGAVYNAGSAPILTNCILWDNAAAIDPEMHNYAGSAPVVAYSCIAGGYDGEANIDVNPLLVDAVAGDLRLQSVSPCIDTGTSVGAPGYDIVGIPRPQGAGYDMGAYEYVVDLTEGEGGGEGHEEGQFEGHLEGQAEGLEEGQVDGEGVAEGEGDPEGEGAAAAAHTADQDDNNMIDLTELLRVIQFFNIRGFHCVTPPATSEDGYLPGAGGDQSCRPHASDYNPQDWQISLTELLRLIQFFNMRGYQACPGQGTEDDFCPGPA
jgi:parallel beta-helix repeat protein